MSQATVSIYAELALKADRLRSDARKAVSDLNAELSKAKTATIKVAAELDPKFQEKFDAAIAKIKVKPVVVPVIFEPVNSPDDSGGGGGGGSGGGRQGAPSRSSTGSGEGNGGGNGGGRGLRGWGRYFGPSILAHEALRVAQGYQNYQIASDRAEIFNDNRQRYQAEMQFHDMVAGVPVVGQAAGLIADYIGDRRGTERTFAESERGDQKSAAMGLGASSARSSNHASSLMASRGQQRFDLQQQYESEDFDRDVIGRMKSEAGGQDVSHAIQQARDAFGRRQQQERIQNIIEMSQAGASLGSEQTVLQARLSGDTSGAENAALQDRQRRREYELRQRDPNLANQYRQNVAPLEQFEQERRQRRERENDIAASNQRVADLESETAQKSLRARGEAYNAEREAIKRRTDDTIAAIDREINKETDGQRKVLLMRERAAQVVAGQADLDWQAIGHALDTDRTVRQSTNTLAADTLESSGQGRGSRTRRLQDSYRERVRKINESNDPDKDRQIQAATADYIGKSRLMARQNALADRSLFINTKDADAASRGQNGVGEVYGLAARVQDMMDDAGDDVRRQTAVSRYRRAEVARMQREMRPKSAQYGLGEYADAIQGSITSGTRNGEALKLLDAWSKGANPLGMMPRQNNGPDGLHPDMRDAINDWRDAAKVIKEAKSIAILEDN